jgi:hypothetical protein
VPSICGPKELAEFVTKGPQKEVGAQRSALSATRRRQAADPDSRTLVLPGYSSCPAGSNWNFYCPIGKGVAGADPP